MNGNQHKIWFVFAAFSGSRLMPGFREKGFKNQKKKAP